MESLDRAVLAFVVNALWQVPLVAASGALAGRLLHRAPGRFRHALWVAVVVVGHDFTDVGHAVALGLGMLIATRLPRPAHWTPGRLAMLGGAAAFGYLVLASTDMLVATAAGLAGAVIGEALSRYRLVNAPAYKACVAASGHRL